MTGHFVHPFDDDRFIAGNGTLALEIVEDLPEVGAIVAPLGGGGLLSGIAAATADRPATKIFAAEPETAAPLSVSLAANRPLFFEPWTASFVDGAGGKSVLETMWPLLRAVDGSIVVTLAEAARAMKLVAERAHVIAEGAAGCAIAAALSGAAGTHNVVAVVSGGNIDLSRFAALVGACENRPVVLSDSTISRLLDEGRIEIDPYEPSLLQPSSVDVRVDRFFRVFHNARYPYIDVKERQEDLTELVEIGEDRPFILHPGEFVLGSTLERITLPDDLVARLEGKSSLGRLGLLIHSTAGFIDPGWDGHVTLELSNVANLPITIYFGMKIGQLSFVQMTEPAQTPYGAGELGSKYQGQQGPTPSRYWQNFERETAK